MIDGQRLSGFIGDIYEAAADPGQVDRIGSAILRAMDVDSGILFTADPTSGEMQRLVSASANFDGAARRDYRAYYHARNEWFQRAWMKKPPYVRRGEELIDYRDFQRTEFCADWCRRVGIFHMIGGVVPVAPGVVAGSGIHRTERRGAFTESERDTYALIMAHVGRALQLATRLGMPADGGLSLEVLHGLGIGLMLLDERCGLVFANAAAERLLSAMRWFSHAARRVTPVHPAERPRFEAEVAAACRTSGGSGLSPGTILAVEDPIDGSLAVTIAPFRAAGIGLGGERAVAAVVFAPPGEAAALAPFEIAELYGLSSAEGRLVARLCDGDSLVESAAALGISVNTAKTQLQSIFLKTGHNRQAQLVAAIRSNPLVRLARPRRPRR